jgi:hypothetical protein
MSEKNMKIFPTKEKIEYLPFVYLLDEKRYTKLKDVYGDTFLELNM